MNLFRPFRVTLVRVGTKLLAEPSKALVPLPSTALVLQPTPPPPTQAERAARIRELKDELIAGMSEAASKAIILGEQLLKDKKEIPHGGWKDYVTYDCGLSMSAAQTYMKLAKNKAQLTQLVAENPQSSGYLSQAQALKFLSSAQQKRRAKKKQNAVS
jgi:hypothetical protein